MLVDVQINWLKCDGRGVGTCTMCPPALPSPPTRTLSASPWARLPPPLPRPPQEVATASPAPSAQQNGNNPIILCTDKKDNQIFLIYEEIQNGAFAKLYMTDGLLIYGEIFAHFLIHPHVWLCNCSTLKFLIYEENLIFFFISVSCLILSIGVDLDPIRSNLRTFLGWPDSDAEPDPIDMT